MSTLTTPAHGAHRSSCRLRAASATAWAGADYGRSLQILARTVGIQAKLTAFVSSLWFITASFMIMIPLVLMLRERGLTRQAGIARAAD